jgi:hypothetical protein
MWNVQPLSNVMVSGRMDELAMAQRQEELTVRWALVGSWWVAHRLRSGLDQQVEAQLHERRLVAE